MIIGSDFNVYDQIASAVGASCEFSGIRCYAGGGALGSSKAVNIFPTPWPVYGKHTHLLMSVYPELDDLLAGRLDDKIRGMIAGAPPGSMLNAWHEVLSLPYRQRYLTPYNVYQMHRKMQSLCHGSNVTYGCLLGGGDLTYLMRCVPPDLGYYGLDLYGNLGILDHPRWGHPIHRWIQFRELARTKDKLGYPWLVIGETNCPDEAIRPAWFKLIASLMHGYGPHALAILTFWAAHGGGLSGPWDPADKATIKALRSICTRYGQ
jgi:hypothetical protein